MPWQCTKLIDSLHITTTKGEREIVEYDSFPFETERYSGFQDGLFLAVEPTQRQGG